METIFEAVKKMNKEEFSQFVSELYNVGWHDGFEELDDEEWVQNRLADITVQDWNIICSSYNE